MVYIQLTMALYGKLHGALLFWENRFRFPEEEHSNAVILNDRALSKR